jgi:hypothetical protein
MGGQGDARRKGSGSQDCMGIMGVNERLPDLGSIQCVAWGAADACMGKKGMVVLHQYACFKKREHCSHLGAAAGGYSAC